MPFVSQPFRRTVKGRVVYDRPIHLYTEADVARIQKAVLARAAPVWDVVLDVCVSISVRLMEAILALVGLQAFASLAVRWLVQMGNWILEQIERVMGRVEREGAAWQIFQLSLRQANPKQLQQWADTHRTYTV